MKEIKFSYAKIDIKYFIAFFHIAYFLYNLKKTHESPAPYRKETKRIKNNNIKPETVRMASADH